MSAIVVGVDGGGSRTRVLVADEHFRAACAAPDIAAHAGALDPQFRHALFLQLPAKLHSARGIAREDLPECNFAGVYPRRARGLGWHLGQ